MRACTRLTLQPLPMHPESALAANRDASKQRCLSPRAAGVFKWMTLPLDSQPPEAVLFKAILFGPHAQAVDVPQLAQASGLVPRAVAKALFALQQDDSIEVKVEADEEPGVSSDWAGLNLALSDLSAQMGGAALALAEASGLCVASVNADPKTAQRLAAGPQAQEDAKPFERLIFFIGSRSFSIASDGHLIKNDPTWVSLFRCLAVLAANSSGGSFTGASSL